MTECNGMISSLTHAEKDRLIEQLRKEKLELEIKVKELKNMLESCGIPLVKSQSLSTKKTSQKLANEILDNMNSKN